MALKLLIILNGTRVKILVDIAIVLVYNYRIETLETEGERYGTD